MDNRAEQNKSNESTGPARVTFLGLITRTIAGMGGGIAGTLVLLIIYILSVSIISPAFGPAENGSEISPLFMFVLMGMIFASTLSANVFAPLFISFTDKERYKRVTTSMFQIFIINIVVFIIIIPVYLFSQGINLELISYAAGLHITFSVLASALVFEILSEYKYAILGVYSTIFAVLGGVALSIMLYHATGTATILLFIALPILWGGIGFVHGILLMLYNWVVSTWGVDYLATTQEYSKDYGVPEEAIETYVEDEPEDTEGVEFLKKR